MTDRRRPSPATVAKNLRVLRDVGLVRVRRNGRHKLYQTRAAGIKPLHEWAATFERYWSHQLLRVKERAEQMARAPETKRAPGTRSSSLG